MKKNFLIITAFLSGVSVMGVELSANRLLAPFFGSSQIVWTVIIGLIMIFMSIGNYFGGKYADKMENMDKLYRNLFLTGIWVLILPWIGKYVILGITFLLVFIGIKQVILFGSLLTCLVLFSFPLIMLGTVSPTLVRFGLKDSDKPGEVAGKIYASSNIGSILGSFLPTFITLPLLGTRKSFIFFAMILMLLSIIYKLKYRNIKNVLKYAIVFSITAILFIIPIQESYAFWDDSVIYEGESIYNYLQVKDTEQYRTFSTNVAFGVQSEIRKNKLLTDAYYDYLLFAPLFNGASREGKLDILILGYGTGSADKLFSYYYPNSNVTGVEIDKKIIDIAKEYFDVDTNRTQIHVMDGRTFLKKDEKKYDLIIVDAYQDVNIPFHMATHEFFEEVKDKLNENGIISINVNMHNMDALDLTEGLLKTLNESFECVFTNDVKGSTNLAVIATKTKNNLTDIRRNIKKNMESKDIINLRERYLLNLKEYTENSKGIIFYDDKAPLEKYSQKVLQKLVEGELEDIRNRIKGKSVKSLLELL